MAHVSLITLGVDDLARATAFYRDMGWRLSEASVDGVVSFLRGGAVVLGLFGAGDLAEDAGLPAEPAAGMPRSALAMNVASPEAVTEALQRAADAGATVTRSARTADWGGTSGYFTDLDGHLWEVAHNPGFPLRPDGSLRLPGEPA